MIYRKKQIPFAMRDIMYRKLTVLDHKRIKKKEKAESDQNGDLRLQAEERLNDRRSDQVGSRIADGKDALSLVHELQVHQIELEMQNEELKRTRMETEDALAKYSDIYDFAPIGLFSINMHGLIQEVNLMGAKLLGVERRNLMNRPFHRFVAPKDRPYFDEFCKSAFETSIKQMCELNLLRDGEPTIYARIDGIAAEDSSLNGRQCRIAVIDITEHKKAESILERYQLISKYAQDIVLLMGRDGRIIEANEAAINAYGYTHDELLSMNIFDLREPETLEKISKQMQLADSEGILFETNHKREDGSTFPVEVSSRGTMIEGRRVLLSIIRDITERKRLEEELRIAWDELEQRVQERTAELSEAKENLEVINEKLKVEIAEHEQTEKDLLKSKEAAEAAVEAKAAFLANMSHELRTPLNAVIGFSSLLLDDNITQEQKEDIESIRNGGEALLAIIDDILEFTRAEKEKMELDHQPFSLKHCIEESLDMVAVQASKKGLTLSQTINYGTPDTIIGDHGRLRQILVNLLTNAVKFTDKGDVSVSVSSKAVEGNQHQIFFNVKDAGIGIPQNRMNEIFEPFAQVERTLSRKRDGVGLGLAITKHLVELMGGKIWTESIQGQGTTFSFTIQAETIPGKQLDFGKIDRGVTSESFPGLKPMRILVAEDNLSNQRVLVEMLKRLGYRADAVADGREVIQALERQDYDLVLMDIKMPEMDGITTAQVIRNLRPENGPKIGAITAFALEGDREKCLEAGMDDYIAKPVQIGRTGRGPEEV